MNSINILDMPAEIISAIIIKADVKSYKNLLLAHSIFINSIGDYEIEIMKKPLRKTFRKVERVKDGRNLIKRYSKIGKVRDGEYEEWTGPPETSGDVSGRYLYCNYKDDKKNGIAKKWYGGGNVARLRHPSFRFDVYCHYKNGKLDGEYKEHYKHGRKYSKETGTVALLREYKDGKLKKEIIKNGKFVTSEK